MVSGVAVRLGRLIRMCGICGMIKGEPLDEADRQTVRRMNAALTHRGPDAAGEYVGEHVMLAMRRLSIIDLEGSPQPLWNEARTLALVFNGEIYNYRELRKDLATRGHCLATHGDGETILHLYEESDVECVHALRGMFAFALWDNGKQRLFLARDRMGEKPLYLYETEEGLLFASELRALLESGRVPRELDPVAVDLFFHYQYIPEPLTAVRGVRKLDAGEWLSVDLRERGRTARHYWSMEEAPPLEGDPAQTIRAELEEVSELVVRSDVPVGVALSGGLDSSVVAAFTARRYPGKMQAFSVGYPGRPPYDERTEAAQLAQYLDIPFHEIELRTEEMRDFFPELVALRDDPIADISGYGYYAVARAAREHGVPVLLQGQGGDELFGAYDWLRLAYQENRLKEQAVRWGWAALPRYLRLKPPPGLRPWQLHLWFQTGCGLQTGIRLFRRHRRLGANRLIFFDTHIDFKEAAQRCRTLYHPAFVERLNAAQRWIPEELLVGKPRLDIALTALVAKTYLRENGVAQGDRLAMASSVEMRLPLLDYRLVEKVIGLRKRHTDFRLPKKYWLRAAVRDVLPGWVLERPKRGFQPPVQEWYQALKQNYGDTLLGGCLVQQLILSPHGAQALTAARIPIKTVTPVYFKALVLEVWCRSVLFGEQLRPQPTPMGACR